MAIEEVFDSSLVTIHAYTLHSLGTHLAWFVLGRNHVLGFCFPPDFYELPGSICPSKTRSWSVHLPIDAGASLPVKPVQYCLRKRRTIICNANNPNAQEFKNFNSLINRAD